MIRIGIYFKLIAQFMGLRQANVYHWELAEFISRQNSSNILLGKVKQSRSGLEWPKVFQEVKVPRFHDNGTGRW